MSSGIFASIVRLSSGSYVLHSTYDFWQYSAYQNNINYAYNRYDPGATVHMAQKEIEGVDELAGMIEEARQEFYQTAPDFSGIPEEERPPLESNWMSVGETRVDGNLFNPYAITAYGFELVVSSARPVDTAALVLANELATKLATRKKFIILDTLIPNKLGSSIMPVNWLQNVVENILTSNQSVVNNFVTDTLMGDPEEDLGKEILQNHRQLQVFKDILGDEEIVFEDLPFDFVQQLINKEQSSLNTTLRALFDRGTISLDPINAAKFIDNWELASDMYAGLYHPTWKNTFITSSPTEYLSLAYSVFRGKTPGEGIDRDKLSDMTIPRAMNYISSPVISTSYSAVLDKAWEFMT